MATLGGLQKVPSGFVGSATRIQEVANPGLRQKSAVAAARKRMSLKEEVARLSMQVTALEAKLAAKDEAAATELGELVSNLKALTNAASGEDAPTSARAIGAGVGGRPATAPYRSLDETTSVVSWSADVRGQSEHIMNDMALHPRI